MLAMKFNACEQCRSPSWIVDGAGDCRAQTRSAPTFQRTFFNSYAVLVQKVFFYENEKKFKIDIIIAIYVPASKTLGVA
jgi:hypothetical protein